MAANAATITVTVDEYGTGKSSLGTTLAINSGPYTIANPLTYTLPFTVSIGGTLQLCEEVSNDCSNTESDVIMFTANSNLLKFWSGNADGAEPGALADTGLPGNLNNPLQRTEVDLTSLGTGFLGYTWTPTSSQAGYSTGNSVSYVLVSEGRLPQTVPEPLTLSLFGAGLAGAFAMRRKARKS